ncbi:acyl-CoA dehydrogenase family protein [Nonomuraea sp. K274]|uniref:Medium-chain specific acyl-CoA dehydrogenase, mitochondrial n=1 Tax=Nonomuraea cypriaca TaxID=1187855 RepID=A0A931A597_9ACTN|nr:acyl-CoA dehydrogenase family protein [Nonomuraea cypriaca]MBF8185004.1 acyl-CoA dehydrogenase family protein [Nonomuraea cypriaca]
MKAAEDLRQRVRAFVDDELLPLEPDVIRWELEASSRTEPFAAEPGKSYLFDPVGDLPPEVYERLLAAARERGLWGIDVPAEYGGLGLTNLDKMAAVEEMAKTIVPFVLPPDSPNLHWLSAACDAGQRARYLDPYARGEITSGVAITEPGAGSDVSGIETTARRAGGRWVLNGRKKWIGKADWADFLIVVAVTDREKGSRGGMTAFLVDRGTPGVVVERRLPTISNYRPCEIRFDDVELGDEQVLGDVGDAFVPMQNRLSVRRLEIAARCVGATERLLGMMMAYAKERVTFGEPLAARQTIQNWIADAGIGLHTSRLVNRDAAAKLDAGVGDIRFEASTAKVLGTELLQQVADRCLQAHGGMGLGKELPIEYYYRLVRVWRIVEGASEIHRVTIARNLLRHGIPGAEVHAR